jgi:hypothetical protein
MFGVSMKPKRMMSRVNALPSGSRLTRSSVVTRGVDSVIMVSTTFCSCSTL